MRDLGATARDAIRAQLWPIPTAALVVAVVLGSQMPRLDRAVDDRLPSWLSAVIFAGDPGSAQTVLDAIASSLITVTSLTFSLTVVTLQLASSQFSPRLLRTFTRDLFVQVTLGLFLATFVFSLAVLRLVRSQDGPDGQGAFVPRLSVTSAFLLAVASVFMLVLFLAHLTRTIRVETMLLNVREEATATIESRLAVRDPDRRPPDPRDWTESDADRRVAAAGSGFVTRIDEGALLRAATGAGVSIVVDVRPGDFVVRGESVARIRGDGDPESVPAEAERVDQVERAVAGALRLGSERTAAQDVAFGLRQLTDVANKALSPGINDPTTAVHAIGHLAVLLCDLADRDLGCTSLSDADGVVRVVLLQPDFADLVEVAIQQPRRSGASDPQVLSELFKLLEVLAGRAAPDRHPVVRSQLDRLQATVDRADLDGTERAVLAGLHQQVVDSLLG